MTMINNEVVSRCSAGHDLDIIIAERLMGWQIEIDQAKIKRLSQYVTSYSQRRWWRTPEGGWDNNFPPYSSNLVAAFRLVAMMVSRGYAFFLIQSDTVNKAAFGDLAAIPDYVVGESMMMAICKAALTASD